MSFGVLLALCACGPRSGATMPSEESTDLPRPPIAKQVPHRLEAHGHVREDPYYWLRDDDHSDPEILEYLRAENAYAEAALAPLRGIRDSLYDEIVARIPKDDVSVPFRVDGYWYYSRVVEGGEYAIHCRRKETMEAPEEIILDENERAADHDFYALGGWSVTIDAKVLAFAEDTVSRRIYTVRFRDLDTGEFLPDVLEGTTGSVDWALDNQTAFYVKRDPQTLRAFQVWRHRLGTSQEEDVLVFEEHDDEFWVSVDRSRSRDYILIGSFQTLSHEYRYVSARNPEEEPTLVLAREPNHEYTVDHAHGRFFISTNWEARDFRLMSVAPRESADKSKWLVEIPGPRGRFAGRVRAL